MAQPWSVLSSIWRRLEARHSESNVVLGIGAAKAPSVTRLLMVGRQVRCLAVLYRSAYSRNTSRTTRIVVRPRWQNYSKFEAEAKAREKLNNASVANLPHSVKGKAHENLVEADVILASDIMTEQTDVIHGQQFLNSLPNDGYGCMLKVPMDFDSDEPKQLAAIIRDVMVGHGSD